MNSEKQKIPNGVVMLANDDGQLLLIKQFRNPVEAYIVQSQLPGGGVE